jgi:hypothetical protein
MSGLGSRRQACNDLTRLTLTVGLVSAKCMRAYLELREANKIGIPNFEICEEGRS